MHRHCDVTRVLTTTCGQLFAAPVDLNSSAEVLVEKKVKG